MEVAACDAFRPAWRRWDTFGLERTAAFETDSLASTRPVEFAQVCMRYSATVAGFGR